MSKQITGGSISDEAAEILARLSEANARGETISEALISLGKRRGITIIQKGPSAGWFNGWFAGSFNHWLSNISVAIRARIRVIIPKLKLGLPNLSGIVVGAVGATYYLLMIKGW